MSDPVEDFFNSAGSADAPPPQAASTGDPTHDFLSTGGEGIGPPPVHETAESLEKADQYGSEAGPGYLLENKDFWKGAGRSAIRTFLTATGTNTQASEREAQSWAQRLGLQAPQTPEGLAGETLGGFAAPLPGGIKGGGPPGVPVSSFANSPQSISAAAASPSLASASPELRAAVQGIRTRGGTVNPEVLERHLEAESLPVPTTLSKGQATQDPSLMSFEQNQRGANPAFAEHFNRQNQNLIDNLQTIRDRAGPDVFSTNPVEHGETLIKAYKAKAAAAEADISAKYKALQDANGGQFPVDAKGLYNNVSQALHKNYLFEHAPAAELRQLGSAAQDGMTFEQYEAMRTNLARTMRSSSDGNEIAAARVMRGELENLPLTGQAATLKPLADSARAAAKAQFDALRADPAYAAAVNGKVTPDRFVNRFIVNGDRDKVALMRQNLAHDDTASQTMSVAAIDQLRNSARIDDLYRGNFAQSGYNKTLQGLSPKFPALFAPKDAGDLSALGSVARNQQFQPRGSFVNNSNTTVSALSDNSKAMLEHIADAKTAGAYSMFAKPLLKGRAARALAEEHLSPGAGLDYSPR